MKTNSPVHATASNLPKSYEELCREVWLPRPIHDKAVYETALDAIEPLWGRETAMTPGQADWFGLVADLVATYETQSAKPTKRLSPGNRLATLLDAHGMNAADLGRFLGLTPGMGSKILTGNRRLTAAHVRALSSHFGLPADYFL